MTSMALVAFTARSYPPRSWLFTWLAHHAGTRIPVRIDFELDGDGTLLTLTHTQFFDDAARDRHRSGWNASLDKLQQLFT